MIFPCAASSSLPTSSAARSSICSADLVPAPIPFFPANARERACLQAHGPAACASHRRQTGKIGPALAPGPPATGPVPCRDAPCAASPCPRPLPPSPLSGPWERLWGGDRAKGPGHPSSPMPLRTALPPVPVSPAVLYCRSKARMIYFRARSPARPGRSRAGGGCRQAVCGAAPSRPSRQEHVHGSV